MHGRQNARSGIAAAARQIVGWSWSAGFSAAGLLEPRRPARLDGGHSQDPWGNHRPFGQKDLFIPNGPWFLLPRSPRRPG